MSLIEKFNRDIAYLKQGLIPKEESGMEVTLLNYQGEKDDKDKDSDKSDDDKKSDKSKEEKEEHAEADSENEDKVN